MRSCARADGLRTARSRRRSAALACAAVAEPKRIDVLDRSRLAMRDGDEHPDYIARMIGLRLLTTARSLGLLVAVFAGALGGMLWVGYWPIAGVLAIGQLAMTARAFSSRWERTSTDVLPLLGIAGLGGLIAASGGAQSPVATVVVAFPAIGAFVLTRRRLLLSGVGFLLALTAASLPDVLQDEPLSDRWFAVNALALGLATIIGAAIASGRVVLRDRVANLYLLRRLLLVDRLSAAAVERRRISGELGAGPLQLLLAARQDLQELRGDPDDPRALDACTRTLGEAAQRLRATIVELRSPRAQEELAWSGETEDDDRLATRMLAVLRVAAAPPIVVAALVGVPGQASTTWLYVLLGLMGTVQAVALTWSFSRHWERFPTTGLAFADMTAVGVLVALSGGAQSPVLATAALLPLTFLLIGPPRVQLRIVSMLVGAVAVAALPDAVEDEPGATLALTVFLLTVGWTSVATFLASIGRRRLELRTATLETARRTLLRDSMSAQDDERSAVARALHDDVLQLVLAALQEVEEARRGAADAVGFALAHATQAIASLREGADELHPSALEHGGLGPALRDVAARTTGRADVQVDVTVDERVDAHHELLIGLTRELLTNVVKHARATTAEVEVASRDGDVLLHLRDDGEGMTRERPEVALAEGHVGLASCRERVEAAGGTFVLRSVPDGGTTVDVRLPAVG